MISVLFLQKRHAVAGKKRPHRLHITQQRKVLKSLVQPTLIDAFVQALSLMTDVYNYQVDISIQ